MDVTCTADSMSNLIGFLFFMSGVFFGLSMFGAVWLIVNWRRK